jgi:hypothetical protein
MSSGMKNPRECNFAKFPSADAGVRLNKSPSISTSELRKMDGFRATGWNSLRKNAWVGPEMSELSRIEIIF